MQGKTSNSDGSRNSQQQLQRDSCSDLSYCQPSLGPPRILSGASLLSPTHRELSMAMESGPSIQSEQGMWPSPSVPSPGASSTLPLETPTPMVASSSRPSYRGHSFPKDFRDTFDRKLGQVRSWVLAEFASQLDMLHRENSELQAQIRRSDSRKTFISSVARDSPPAVCDPGTDKLSFTNEAKFSFPSDAKASLPSFFPSDAKALFPTSFPSEAKYSLPNEACRVQIRQVAMPAKDEEAMPAKDEMDLSRTTVDLSRTTCSHSPKGAELTGRGALLLGHTDTFNVCEVGSSNSEVGKEGEQPLVITFSVAEELDTTNTVLEKWLYLVCQLCKPTFRAAAMKRFVPSPLWAKVARESPYLYKWPQNRSTKKRKSVGKARLFPSLSSGDTLSLGDCMVNPTSLKRKIWLLICLLLTLYDAIITPFLTCFGIDEHLSHDYQSVILKIVSQASQVFWSLDIVANFMTGAYIDGFLEMRPRSIAIAYARSWLLFDASLVISQWITNLLAKHDSTGKLSIFKWLRALCVLRIVRLLRLGKDQNRSYTGHLHALCQHVLDTDSEGVMACMNLLKTFCFLSFMIHVLGCIWYAVGRIDADGWAYEPSVDSSSILHKYVLSVQWAAARVHGNCRPTNLTTTEHLIAGISSYLGLLTFLFLVANATPLLLQFNNVKHWKMKGILIRFCDSHQISHALSVRIQHYLNLSHRHIGISEEIKEDASLLSALPVPVRADVVNELRWPLLENLFCLHLLYNFNARTMKMVCQDAVTVHVALEQETVFEEGDQGKSVFIVQFGKFAYLCHRRMLKSRAAQTMVYTLTTLNAPIASRMCTKNLSDDEESYSHKTLSRGDFVSESVLWTSWEHTGNLVSIADSTMLVLDPERFVEVVSERQDVLSYIAVYASKFVNALNQVTNPTDLFSFNWEAAMLTGLSTHSLVDADRHLIFLSHFKQEAGTEATLMQEALARMISQIPECPECEVPVFLDSANLNHLGEVRAEVEKSENLVLLLTPGVLKRPWCLVEIATAFEKGVRIVPVVVERPGISFKYPDELFYYNLKAGKLLSKGDHKVLRSEGVSRAAVERSLRHVFQQIALPFSPHKSTQIRQAELSGILQRCYPDVVQSEGVTHAPVSRRFVSFDNQQWSRSSRGGGETLSNSLDRMERISRGFGQ